jgi:UDP-N-acetyl-D-galactosamine dehydrogenase
MNELAIIFDRLGIDTTEVLEAAETKWNFLKFRPGLVGGHCIGVDPYYLTHKAEVVGYHPQVILAGRRINDGMGKFVAERAIKLIAKAGKNPGKANVSVLGLTFKENCPDIRNSKVVDVIRELQDYGAHVHVHDPMVEPLEAMKEYGIKLVDWNELPMSDALIVAVAHQDFLLRPVSNFRDKLYIDGCILDVKSALNLRDFKAAGLNVWRL